MTLFEAGAMSNRQCLQHVLSRLRSTAGFTFQTAAMRVATDSPRTFQQRILLRSHSRLPGTGSAAH